MFQYNANHIRVSLKLRNMKDIKVKGYRYDELEPAGQKVAVNEAFSKLMEVQNPDQAQLDIISKFRAMESHFLPTGHILK